MTGMLEQIWIKRAKLGPMAPKVSANLRADRGLGGNANQGGRRQVTIIEQERWAAHMAALGLTESDGAIPPSRRRANLLVRDCPLANSRGKVLRIGAVRLRIAGETKPCHQMDEVHDGLEAVALSTTWARRAGLARILSVARCTTSLRSTNHGSLSRA